jgi:hypothetical protein
MDFIPVINATKIYSDSGTEYIDIKNIQFTYDSTDTIFYKNITIDAVLHRTENSVYVEFNDTSSLCRTIGFRNFYILNQVYKFDPTISTRPTSTILFSKKTIEDLDILVDAIIEAYNGKINVRLSDYINFRLHNNCCITIYFSYVYDEDDNEGYIIELIHEQTTLYKQQFKAFVVDFTKLIE